MRERCQYDNTELDEAMECSECLNLIVAHGQFRSGKSKDVSATLALLDRARKEIGRIM